MTRRFVAALAFAMIAALGTVAGSVAHAQAGSQPEVVDDSGVGETSGWAFDWGVELRAHYRDSDHLRIASPFPAPPSFPAPGQTKVFMETVDQGSHVELSTVTLFLDVSRGDLFEGRLKVDGVDRYDRNPTSSDKKVDVDELWLRFGRDPGELPERASVYAKLGKFAHFERQNDRHLESYGLISTAFNRFEDQGLELGAAFGRHFYVKVSATQGNPVFFRDPNSLAGDNGTPERNPVAHPNPNPELKSGFPILYDAEVEEPDFDEPELGYGLGIRFGEPGSGRELNLLGWTYERDLLDEVDLHGTFYGGDLDLLNGPDDSASLPIHGRRKEEVGANLWLYLGGFSLYGQYVAQEIAGMDRDGYEVEAAWRIDLPLGAAVAGRQLFPSIQPAVRYSYLKPEFAGGGPYPAPSVRWEWVKLDYGIRIVIVEGLDVTVEFADNEMTLANGSKVSNDELLGTLRFKI